MTTDLCIADDVARFTGAQAQAQAGESGAVAGRVQASSAVVELGRKLLQAARDGDTRAVLDLMAKGAPFTTDWLGTSPLHMAAQNAHAETCAVLLRAGISRDTRTKVERTPLHLAAYEGHAAVAELLLGNGALVDCRDMLRMTPLHWAVERGNAACAEVLLRFGADPRARSKFGRTPLSLAALSTPLRALFERAARDAALAIKEKAGVSAAADADNPSPERPLREAVPPRVIPRLQPRAKPRPGAAKQGGDAGPEEPAAKLLRRHGITLLPADDGGTVLTALQSGRTVVLSDAGKIMLKESEAGPAGASPRGAGGGVLLTATPVTSPPRPGVKIFTLPHKLVARRSPHGKIKYVQLPPDAKIVPATTGEAGARPPAGDGEQRAPRRHTLVQLRAPPMKLVLRKNSLEQLPLGATDAASAKVARAMLRPPSPPPRPADADCLRAELLVARATILRLRGRLRRARRARTVPSPCSSPSPPASP